MALRLYRLAASDSSSARTEVTSATNDPICTHYNSNIINELIMHYTAILYDVFYNQQVPASHPPQEFCYVNFWNSKMSQYSHEASGWTGLQCRINRLNQFLRTHRRTVRCTRAAKMCSENYAREQLGVKALNNWGEGLELAPGPQTPLGDLTTFPQSDSLAWLILMGPTSKRMEGSGGEVGQGSLGRYEGKDDWGEGEWLEGWVSTSPLSSWKHSFLVQIGSPTINK